jgi:hypothetical protein
MSDTLNLVVGDWSRDGHNQTDSILVSTALTAQDVQDAWRTLERDLKAKYNFTLYDNVCSEYEESQLNEMQVIAFLNMGIDLDSIAENYSENPSDPPDYHLGSDSYAELVIELLNKTNPALELKSVPHQYNKEINIGGYGLFWN